MLVQESSAPEVEQTLHLRKTPKLPPPRASTPKHTHIGSPKRMSTGRPHTTGKPLRAEDEAGSPLGGLAKTQPPANRVLDFTGDGTKGTVDSASPFKPKNTLRRSMGLQSPRRNVFKSGEQITRPARESLVSAQQEATEGQVDEEDEEDKEDEEDEDDDETVHQTELQTQLQTELETGIGDNEPVHFDIDDGYQPAYDDTIPGAEEAQTEDAPSSPAVRKAGRPRMSIESVHDTLLVRSPSVAQSTTPGSRKRDRVSMEGDQTLADDASLAGQEESILSAGPSANRKRGRTHEEPADDPAPKPKKPRGRPRKNQVTVHQEAGSEAIDRQSLAHGDQYIETESPVAPKERDPNRAMRAATSPVRSSKSPSKQKRGASAGPVSNVNLRATTPLEDAGARVSRYGRAVIKPLQYWANESRVWKNGEIEGIIRAQSVEAPSRRKGGKKRGRKPKKGISKLEDIDEESETESTFADEWEDEVGVIAGTVADWDSTTNTGDAAHPIREDLAFAASSIVTRDVAGSEFKYAKIMTMPFFGCGLVELPPEGFKRAKNSQKMQMCFFVHGGKVMVEIGARGGGEVNQFAISKGGVWVVPRGEFSLVFSFLP